MERKFSEKSDAYRYVGKSLLSCLCEREEKILLSSLLTFPLILLSEREERDKPFPNRLPCLTLSISLYLSQSLNLSPGFSFGIMLWELVARKSVVYPDESNPFDIATQVCKCLNVTEKMYICLCKNEFMYTYVCVCVTFWRELVVVDVTFLLWVHTRTLRFDKHMFVCSGV